MAPSSSWASERSVVDLWQEWDELVRISNELKISGSYLEDMAVADFPFWLRVEAAGGSKCFEEESGDFDLVFFRRFALCE